jgi:uncharacterized lipoprotein YmbA
MTPPFIRSTRAAAGSGAIALTMCLAACLSGCFSVPASRSYLLRPASQVPMVATSNPGLPVLALEPVRVPDYLDTTELVLRDGEHRIKDSRSGHWGERLSSGVSEFLQGDLARRLPGEWVISARDGGDSARNLNVHIERFDVWADGHCVLVASWTLRDPARDKTAAPERAVVELPTTAPLALDDARVVAAMDDTLDILAGRIAASIEADRGPPASAP